MPKISHLKSRQVFDSRGFPTVETDVFLTDGSVASAIIPSGHQLEVMKLMNLEIKTKNI